jgi:hypothetical protein
LLQHALLQEALAGLDKKSAVEHLHNLFPHQSKSYFNRNYLHILTLDPLGLSRILGHSDPTADTAIRNVERNAA